MDWNVNAYVRSLIDRLSLNRHEVELHLQTRYGWDAARAHRTMKELYESRMIYDDVNRKVTWLR